MTLKSHLFITRPSLPFFPSPLPYPNTTQQHIHTIYIYSLYTYSDLFHPTSMTLDPDSRDIIERVKARLLSNGGVSGINGIRRMIARMDTDSSKTVDREEFRIGLRDYGVTNISDADMDKLFNYFDKDRSGRINAHEFLRGLSTGMSYERKQLVREAFNRLDLEKKGYITSSDILMCYDVSGIPEVAGTAITPEQAAQRMMVTLSPETYDTGVITWANFLDYYKDLSLAITDDDYFELMIRNSWHLGGGVGDTQSTTTRRIVVVHSNGRQEVVELMDDLGINWRENDTEAIIERLEQQGVRDIAGIKL